jgi:UDP-glucose 4-epimerase
MTRIVVTGASGNVGTALLRRLLTDQEESYDVVGVVRRPPQVAAEPWSRVRWVAADLASASIPTLVEAFRGADAVVHLAWGFQPSHRPGYLEAVGVGGTRRVLEAVETAGVPHLVHQSSIGAYAPRSDLTPVDESYPATGVPSSPYSRHKAAAEEQLDAWSLRPGAAVVTRFRPTLIGQHAGGGGQARYFLPTVVPPAVLTRLPVLPLASRIALQFVHADDVATAIVAALRRRAAGAFNLAGDGVLRPPEIAEALGARLVEVPPAVLRWGCALSWHTGLQPVDPGWVDLALQVPVLDTQAARRELDWTPQHTSAQVLREMIAAVASGAQPAPGRRTPPLRPRTTVDGLISALRRGPVSLRRLP